MKHTGLFAFLVAAALLASACSNSSSSPSNTVDGTWVGTIVDSIVGQGTVRVTLASNGSNLSGQWGTTYPNPVYSNSGSAAGTLTGSSLSVTLTPSVPTSCPSRITATVNGNQITGTYAAFNCSLPDSGSVTLTKQ